ncbi:hypothetical protein LPJ63_003286 [Coemansia sp. RSA 2711]|nr:hypothetical protein LPJ63_003286 [Coemansia sp. RSA 2711]
MLGQLLASIVVAVLGYQATQLLRPTPSVRGKSVVIVGASSGIGRSLALEYARGGAQLLLSARRAHELSQVAEECRQLGAVAEHVSGDITRPETQQELLAAATRLFAEGVDYLVLNAGALSVQPVLDLWGMRDSSPQLQPPTAEAASRADTALRQIMEINAIAPINTASWFLPLLAKRKGSIVVVSSIAGMLAAPTRSLYSASKHAVAGYFAALRMEVRVLDVTVTIVYPGTVDTELRQSAVDREDGASVAGSKRGKMSPLRCARQILRAAALRQPTLITPLPYWISSIVHAFAPGLVEYLARRKYGLP